MYKKRRSILRKVLDRKGIDLFLVTNPYNIYYLSGLETLSFGEREVYLLVSRERTYGLVSGLYHIKNKDIIPLKLEPERRISFYLKEIIFQDKISVIGFEAEDLRVSEYKKLTLILKRIKKEEGKLLKKLRLIPVEKMILSQRSVKEVYEIGLLRKAARVTSQCLREIVSVFKEGITEKELAWKIEVWLKSKGYASPFNPIVAIDESSAIPHYNSRQGKRRLKKGSLILIDFGVNYKGYCSDITRVFFYKKADTAGLNLYNSLLDIQKKTIDFVGEEKEAAKVDLFSRGLVKKRLNLDIPHSIGHGVGLETHEFPRISPGSPDILKNNQVFTIEPGVYLPDRFGLRVEDTVVRKRNRVEVLTKFPKRPIII